MIRNELLINNIPIQRSVADDKGSRQNDFGVFGKHNMKVTPDKTNSQTRHRKIFPAKNVILTSEKNLEFLYFIKMSSFFTFKGIFRGIVLGHDIKEGRVLSDTYYFVNEYLKDEENVKRNSCF